MGSGSSASKERSNVEDYLSQLVYDNSKRVCDDVTSAIQAFPALCLGIGYFTDTTDGTSDLLFLKGNLRIFFRGRSYAVPITVWLLRRYPHVAPRILVNATAGLVIPEGRPDVDLNGNLIIGYFYDWMNNEKTLRRLLQVLVTSFSLSPPIFSLNRPQIQIANRQPLSPVQQKLIIVSESLARLSYQNTEVIIRHLIDVFSNFPDLHPGEGCYEQSSVLIYLKGTITAGSEGRIPVIIWIPQYYPLESPYVSVTSSDQSPLVGRAHVDADGRVRFPYILDWDQDVSNLVGILEVMVVAFASVSPIHGHTSHETPSAPRRSQEENLCKICMEKPMNVVFLLCKHLACCQDCAEDLTHCPICREPIQRKIHIFPT